MKILLVWNPNAGGGRAAALSLEAVELFEHKGSSVDLRLTESPGHAVRIVREADFANYDGVVAAGGDGTLCEAVNGYCSNPARGSIPLGILPMGSGNAFARDVGMEADRWRESVEIIAAGRRRRADVGLCTCGGKTSYFLNILELGFVADMIATAVRLKIFGHPPYLLSAALQMLFLQPYAIRIEADGRVIERENLYTAISNARGYTSRFLLAPQACLDDGLLDVTMAGGMGRLRLLGSIPRFFTGGHQSLPEVETFRASRLRIGTAATKVLCSDGELAGSTPVEVECLKQDIEIFGCGSIEERHR